VLLVFLADRADRQPLLGKGVRNLDGGGCITVGENSVVSKDVPRIPPSLAIQRELSVK
jgi:hypothetical protein